MAASHERPPLVADLLRRDPVDGELVERVRKGVAERRQGPARRRASGLVAAAAVVAGVSAAAVLLLSGPEARTRGGPSARDAGPLLLSGRGALAQLALEPGASAASRIGLSDGSSIVLSPGTRLVATENSGQRLALRLEAGRATFDVVPGGPRRWSVDAGLASVEVVGTRFTVERDQRLVRVSVERGRVRLISAQPPGPRVLGAGESASVQAPEPGPGPEPVRGPAPPAPDQAPTLPDVLGASGGPTTPAWQQLAADGEYGRAYELLGPAGVRREVARAETMERLLALADVARLSGHPGDAVEPLERALDRFSGDTRAAVAAFTLGRLEADVLGRHQRAARAFRRCLDLDAPQALREDAHARLAEAHARSGDLAAARDAARDYLERFPEGRRASELRRWAEPE